MLRPVILPLAVLLLAPSPAVAQPAGAQAEVLFRQGRDLLAKGKIAEACSAFAESQKLEPATTTLLNLAGCREKQGQLATAWGLFLDAERETRAATDAAGRQLHTVARDRAAKLEGRVSKLTINVPASSQADGLELLRDHDRVDAALWNRALPIDGGTYTVSAHAPGTSTWSTQLTVGAEGDVKTIDIPDLRTLARDLPPVSAEAAPAAAMVVPATPVADRDETSHGGSMVVPIVVGAGALALIGGAIGFELKSDSTYNDAKAEMTSQSRRDSLQSTSNHERYAAEGLGAAGVVAAGVAVWLYLHDRHASSSTTATRTFVVSPTGVAWAGTF